MKAIARAARRSSDVERSRFGLLDPQSQPEVPMFTSDPLADLAVAHERGRRLRAEAYAARLRGAPGTRRALAATLRRAADRLDPALARPARPPRLRVTR